MLLVVTLEAETAQIWNYFFFFHNHASDKEETEVSINSDDFEKFIAFYDPDDCYEESEIDYEL